MTTPTGRNETGPAIQNLTTRTVEGDMIRKAVDINYRDAVVIGADVVLAIQADEPKDPHFTRTKIVFQKRPKRNNIDTDKVEVVFKKRKNIDGQN